MEFIEYTIGKLALEVKTGKTPPTSNPLYFEGEVNWFTPSDLKGQKFIEKSERTITELALEERKAFLYEPGTILISTIGDIGKACLITKPAASNQQLTGIVVDKEIIIPELFYYWILRSKKLLNNKANKAVISILNNKLLKQIKVSFPKSYEEQSKVVAQLNKIQELIDRRLKSIELLEEYSRSVFLEVFGDPVLDYKALIPFKEVLNNIRSGWSPPNVENVRRKNTEIAILKQSAISSRAFYPGEHKVLLNAENVDIDKKIIVEQNDLLFSRKNTPDYVGASGYVFENTDNLVIPDTIFKLVYNKDKVSGIYLYYLLNDENYKLKVQRIAKGSATSMKGISQTRLKELEIPLPDRDKQDSFEKHILKIQSLKKKYKLSLSFLRNLFEFTLQDSFGDEVIINEENIFEDLIKGFDVVELKKGQRVDYLLNWLKKDKKKERFSSLQKYYTAIDKLLQLLEDGTIEQSVIDNNIKLRTT